MIGVLINQKQPTPSLLLICKFVSKRFVVLFNAEIAIGQKIIDSLSLIKQSEQLVFGLFSECPDGK